MDTQAQQPAAHRGAGSAAAAPDALPLPSAPGAVPRLDQLPEDAPMRVRLLTAAVELLETEGFAGLTQSAVARRAGVRQSHLTYYFPTRAALLRATAQFGMEAVLTPITGAAALGRLTLDEYKARLLPNVEDRGWCRLMNELGSACAEDPGIRDWLKQFNASIRASIRNGFVALGIPATEADILVLHMAYVGALHQDMTEMSEQSLANARQAVAHTIDVLVAAIRARESGGGAPCTLERPSHASARGRAQSAQSAQPEGAAP